MEQDRMQVGWDMGHKMGLQEEQKIQWDAGGWEI